jgi:hypothetical protein
MTCHGFIVTGESDFSGFSVTFKGGAGVQSADLSHGFQGVVGRLRGIRRYPGAFAIAATATSAPAPAPLPSLGLIFALTPIRAPTQRFFPLA